MIVKPQSNSIHQEQEKSKSSLSATSVAKNILQRIVRNLISNLLLADSL